MFDAYTFLGIWLSVLLAYIDAKESTFEESIFYQKRFIFLRSAENDDLVY